MKRKVFRVIGYVIAGMLGLFVLWLLLPAQRVYMPVDKATSSDYNNISFWYYPWGEQRHHIGIDIFAPKGRDVHPACAGVVIRADGKSKIGGNVVYVVGSGGRIYYYAHLNEILTHPGAIVSRDDVIGRVGRTGNASRPGCPPHLHFTIFSLVPQSHDIEESEASLNARDHGRLRWLVDPAKALKENSENK
ncbi:MAG: M23 family metallopeptidase [Muribaculaceae bacterium]|nr:M23 family metallopeptidase [Muribaculaceae bacterium]